MKKIAVGLCLLLAAPAYPGCTIGDGSNESHLPCVVDSGSSRNRTGEYVVISVGAIIFIYAMYQLIRHHKKSNAAPRASR